MSEKKLVLGILAHVDAGKTTLSESILFKSGRIREMGRVDHQNAFLDTAPLERARGITIFSKQAVFSLEDITVTLLDTPGHVDFSAEMERTLGVLDYAVLVINGADGVQGHTLTLWKLLKRYQIPVFLFINKMDQKGTDKDTLLQELTAELNECCIDFGLDPGAEEFLENLAMCDETVMEEFLEQGRIKPAAIAGLIRERKVFPCYFGSALKVIGVDELLAGIAQYVRCPEYPQDFGCKVYKISRDQQGRRLTHLKITGGCLQVKEFLSNSRSGAGEISDQETGQIWKENVDQIRIYSGDKFEMVESAPPGTVCAVTGLQSTIAGDGLGIEKSALVPLLTPVLTYRLLLPPECDIHGMLGKLRQLEEEEPQLHILWDERSGEIKVQVMGEVEAEILICMIRDRYGVEAQFGPGSLIYKETILSPVEGVGHFEPLRHYAEVHLLLEPGEPGSGLQFARNCSEELLSRNWQRLILSHLQERTHPGVLTGGEITDLKITLIAGRAHQKHTEGGDFRQATYRALRQGLKKARSVLLEPIYEFRLEVPTEMTGRALSDIQRMYGRAEIPETTGDRTVICGQAPVALMGNYQQEVSAYSRGYGRLLCTLKGYEPCHNEAAIIAAKAYDSEQDMDHPTGSVFCSHGAGFYVPWDKVEAYMHLEAAFKPETEAHKIKDVPNGKTGSRMVSEQELTEIFERTYGTIKRERNQYQKTKVTASSAEAPAPYRQSAPKKEQDKYLLVDGYNIIFAWEELKSLAEINLDSARYQLMDVLCNYQGYRQERVIVVFDAYKVVGNPGAVEQYHNIHVVYTKEAETADQYIEKVVHQIGRKYDVTVATSDGMMQLIIWGDGAKRLSAAGLKEEIERVKIEIQEIYPAKQGTDKNYPFQNFFWS